MLLTLCMLTTLLPMQGMGAGTGQNAYVISSSNGRITYYDDFLTAWGASQNGDTVGLLADKHLSQRVNLNKGSRTVELNGHKLYRQNNTDHDDGAIFKVNSSGTLSVYGGRQAWSLSGDTVTMPATAEEKVAGTYFDGDGFAQTTGTASRNLVWHLCYFDYDSREVKYKNNDDTYAVSGGLLCGGWSSGDGGGIQMTGESASVALYDVTVAGNIAEDNGGGVAMLANYQKLTLTDSRIAYNWAREEDGGGIFVDGKYCKVYLTMSHVDYNLSEDNGGGIAVNGDNAVIAGDAQRVNPDDASYPGMWDSNTNTSNPYRTLNGDHNPFWGRTENSSSKHVSTAGQKSTMAYNIVTNSDYDGGGGGIYVDGDNTAVGGLNIMKNLALGFGLNATWCGRGAGVLLNTEGNTLANCNVWKNWSRSEGGGVFVDNDSCTLTDVTVTNNYSDTRGWSGGGVYVLGTVNLSLGGQCVIKNNNSYDRTYNDNLYLGYYNAMYARLYPSLTKGSQVWLWQTGVATDITKVPGVYDERMFYSDDGGYHVEYKDQILKLVKGKKSSDYIAAKYPDISKTELTPDYTLTSGSRTVKLSDSYTSGGGNSYPLYQGVAEFPAFLDSSADLSSTFFYSDGYFDQSPMTYNSHLATASLHLALSGFYSNDGNKKAALYNDDGNGTFYPAKSNNIRQFLSDIGVKEENIFLNDYNIQKPGQFTIGVGIGSKDITVNGQPKKLVILGIRGGGYEQEWVSNMTLGSEGEAKGFGSAADQVFSFLNQYLRDKGIDGSDENTLFWMAGFSRAGATSNLTGARIVDKFDTAGERTFVYTFEAPQGGMSTVRTNGENYRCIHNIINDTDLVPQVGPSAMGFHRYGVDHYVPGNPEAGTLSGHIGSYYVLSDNGNSSVKKTFTTYSDNSSYSVGSDKYNTQKGKMLTQLKYIAGYDLIYSDYFHAATISYLGNRVFGKLGWQMIDEDSDWQSDIPSENRNTAGFIPYFLNDWQEKSLNFMKDSDGNEIDKLYRLCYSQATLGGVPVEQAAASAAGVVFGLTAEQMTGLSEIAGTLMDRIDVSAIYKNYLEPAVIDIFADSKTAESILDEVWTALNKPTDEQLKDKKIADKYKEACAKGYKFLQDVLTDEQIATLEKSVPALGLLLLDYLKDDYKATGNDVLGTMVYNVSRILSNHYPEVDLAWLRTYDSYYNNESGKVVMADSAKVTSVAAPVANDSNNSNVTISCADPTVKLTVLDDVDRGAGIFYQFTGSNAPDTDWHPYCGAIPLTGADGVSYTLNTYAIHDKIRSQTNTISLTMRADRLLTYTYPDETDSNKPYSQKIFFESGMPFSFEAPVMETKAFKAWTVTAGDKSKLSGFVETSRTNTVTISSPGQYSLEAVYFDKSNAVSLTMDKIESEKTLPATAILTKATTVNGVENGKNVSVPVTWTKGGNNTYTATISLPVDTVNELCYIGQESGEGYNTVLNAAVSVHQNNQSNAEKKGDATGIVNADGSAVVQQTFTLSGYTDPQNTENYCTLTVKAVDSNTGESTDFSVGGDTLTYSVAKGTTITLPIPAVTSEQYSGVEYKGNIGNIERNGGSLTFTMPDENVILTLKYTPIVYKLALVFDKAPVGNETLPQYVGSIATIENNWAITEGITNQWSPKDTKTYYNTPYTAQLTLIKSSLEGGILSEGNSWVTPQSTQSLSGNFSLAPDVLIKVIDTGGKVIPAACTVATNDGTNTVIKAAFPPTAKAPVTAVFQPSPVMVDYGTTEENMKAALPTVLTATLEDGTTGQVSVTNWTLQPYSPSLNGYTVTATGTLSSSDYDLKTNDIANVLGTVSVGQAPKAEAPKAGLILDGMETAAGSNGETVRVGENGNYSVQLKLSAASGAAIWYTLGDGEPDTEYSTPIEIGWGNDTDSSHADKTVTVKAYTAESGKRDSEVVTLTYTLRDFYAKESSSSGKKSYSVTAAQTTNGTISLSQTKARSGAAVTITVTPEKGYTLETLTVMDKNGRETELTAVAYGETYTFKMPSADVTVTATFMDDNTMLNYFVDVFAKDWYYDAVLWAAQNGVANGVNNTHFAPKADCTRAHMVTFLWRAAGCPEPKTDTTPFVDVDLDSYYGKAVLWAVEQGITNGMSKTKFKPEVIVTRGQMATFLFRFAKAERVNTDLPFADVREGDYFYDAVVWAYADGLTNGVSKAKYAPDRACTRGQIVTFLYRYFAG